MQPKPRSYLALTFILSALFALGAAEAGAYLLLSLGWRFPRVSANEIPYVRNPSPYELKESLSSFPVLKEKVRPVEGSSPLKWVSVVESDAGVWAPPRLGASPAGNYSPEGKRVSAEIMETTDAQRRRVSPWQSERVGSAKRHLLALGCSVTWGQGVGDGETYPAQMSKYEKELISYNAGYIGYGPAESLMRLKYGSALHDIRPPKGMAIYAVFSEHYKRYHNSARLVGTWRPNGMVLEEFSRGEFEPIGLIRDVRSYWVQFSRYLMKDPIATLFQLDWPRESGNGYGEMIRVIQEMRKIYRQKTSPENAFVVVILPFGKDAGLRRALERSDLQFIDYSSVDMARLLNGPATLPGDPHPTPEFYEKLAIALNRDLAAVGN